MKRAALVVFISVICSIGAFSQTSIGVILGEPTGLSAKIFVAEAASLDVAFAWSFTNTGVVYVHLDYQQHFPAFDVSQGRSLWFLGVGGKVYIGNDVTIGARIPIGLVFEFSKVPLEVFLEIAPGLRLFPATQFDAGAGVGLRYRF